MSRFTRRALLQGSAATLAAGYGFRPHGVAAGSFAAARTSNATSALDDLRARLNGTLMLPSDSGYATAGAPANGRYRDILPIAIARVADEADVVTCVNWCVENGIQPVARGGGHSYAGFSTTTGLLIDLRRLNGVSIDHHSGSVVCGGAALNGDFFIATENSPHFLPGGTCLGVGIGGLCLGGGIGYNTHWAGLTCDHLQASRIVTADGSAREIDPGNDADLFWACRGGAGGSFGINTSFTFDLVEAPQADIGYYRFEWQGADAAAAVLAAFDTLIQSAPPALNAVAMAEATAVSAGGPAEAIHVMSRGQYIGSLDELRDLVSPLLEAAKPTTETLESLPFWQMQRMIATNEPPQHCFGDICRYAAAPLPASAVDAVVELLIDSPSRSDDANCAFWSLGWVGGDVVNGIDRTDTAYVHRGVTSLLRPTTVWPNDAPESVANDLIGWTSDAIAAIAPHTLAESYQNFPNRLIDDWQTEYYAENWSRLVEVKTRYDPDNLFQNPQSIPPA